jgi:hypothetical protein
MMIELTDEIMDKIFSERLVEIIETQQDSISTHATLKNPESFPKEDYVDYINILNAAMVLLRYHYLKSEFLDMI